MVFKNRFKTDQLDIFVPNVGVLDDLGELEAQNELVDLQQAPSHLLDWKVSSQGFLVHRILRLDDQVGVVRQVPEVQVAAEVVAVFFALQKQNLIERTWVDSTALTRTAWAVFKYCGTKTATLSLSIRS